MAPSASRLIDGIAFRLGRARFERVAEVWKIWLSLMRCVFMSLISPRGDDLLAYFKVRKRVGAGKLVTWASMDEARIRFLF